MCFLPLQFISKRRTGRAIHEFHFSLFFPNFDFYNFFVLVETQNSFQKLKEKKHTFRSVKCQYFFCLELFNLKNISLVGSCWFYENKQKTTFWNFYYFVSEKCMHDFVDRRKIRLFRWIFFSKVVLRSCQFMELFFLREKETFESNRRLNLS